MANKVFSRQEFFFLQNETTYGQIPNTTGTATVAGSNACAMIQFKMKRNTGKVFRKDKTGSRTARPGIAGRKNANWSTNMSLVTSGTAGTAADCDPILRSLFGGAPTAKSGTATVTAATNASPIVLTATGHGLAEYDLVNVTSVGGNTAANGVWFVHVVDANTVNLLGSTGNAAYTSGGIITKTALVYAPVDAQPSFSAYSYRAPGSPAQRALSGAVAKTGTFHLNEDIATWQADGDAQWFVDSLNFSNATTTEKAGLTAFPSQPSVTALNGTGIPGFKGQAILNGVGNVRIRSVDIKYGSGLDLPQDVFNSGYVDIPEADERSIMVAINLYEDDSAAQAALEQAAIDNTQVDFLFQQGTVPGNIVGMACRGLQLASPDRDDSQRAVSIAYPDSRAYGSGLNTFDEMKLWHI